MNPLQALHEAGQSIWLDFLRRGLITDGGLARLIHDDGVTGVTSNPTIFAKAMVGSNDYDDAIGRIARRGTVQPLDVFYDLALDDIRMAADLFAPVYEQTAGADGFVSFELEARLEVEPSTYSAWLRVLSPSGSKLGSPCSCTMRAAMRSACPCSSVACWRNSVAAFEALMP
jgi:hypothetical protein